MILLYSSIQHKAHCFFCLSSVLAFRLANRKLHDTNDGLRMTLENSQSKNGNQVQYMLEYDHLISVNKCCALAETKVSLEMDLDLHSNNELL